MANAAKELSRLVPKAGPLDRVAPSTGGEGVTWEDVCHAMAGLDRHLDILLRYKWANEYGLRNDLIRKILVRASNLPEVKQIKLKPGQLRRLSGLALDDLCADHRCQICKGTQFLYGKPCPECKGDGIIFFTYEYKGGRLGITKQSWGETWEKRYKPILSMVTRWEHIALSHVRQNLKSLT